ncbi:MAG: Zn-ribbon domain-containing OB-fold protein, partial [Candidatus Aenigmarchaeota archaeon]|nr:Zn-ribbon domain-containing OB-fold protein [Candidatus Aenigmarchaeota archaeon]MDI6722318.1 Zn-ribbon domain-containing OB-fold protein [Candidatus Aenigmarchaeota archaeon]
MPHRSSVSMPWRLKKSRYNFIGSCCKKCDKIYFPLRGYCPSCHEKTDETPLTGNGTILTYTENHVAPAGFEKYVPYTIAIIELEEGPMIAGHVIGDVAKIDIGKNVRAVFRKLFEDGES